MLVITKPYFLHSTIELQKIKEEMIYPEMVKNYFVVAKKPVVDHQI